MGLVQLTGIIKDVTFKGESNQALFVHETS
jgi:hypothetical protein